jgi:hypothetical protein
LAYEIDPRPKFSAWIGQPQPAAANYKNGLFVKVPCDLTEFQETNPSVSITRD